MGPGLDLGLGWSYLLRLFMERKLPMSTAPNDEQAVLVLPGNYVLGSTNKKVTPPPSHTHLFLQFLTQSVMWPILLTFLLVV